MIAAEQRRPDRTIIYLGEQVDGIRAELDALSPDWRTTIRVVHGPSGALVGASLAEWDERARAGVDARAVGRRLRRRVGAMGPAAVRRRGRPDPGGDRRPGDVRDRGQRAAGRAGRRARLDADGDELRLRARRAAAAAAGRRAGAGRRRAADRRRRRTSRRSSRCTRPSSRRRTSRPPSSSSGPRPASRSCSWPRTTAARSPATSPVGCSPTGRATSTSSPSTRPRRGAGVGRRLVVGLVRRVLPATTTGRVTPHRAGAPGAGAGAVRVARLPRRPRVPGLPHAVPSRPDRQSASSCWDRPHRRVIPAIQRSGSAALRSAYFCRSGWV